jgi:LacI family transcriptional regulator
MARTTRKARKRIAARPKTGVRAVAEAAGVSAATVSRTLNSPDSVNEVMRDRVLGTAAKLGYLPNPAAKALRMRRSYLVGAVIPTLDHAFFARMVNAFQETLTGAGYTVIIMSVGFDNTHIFDSVKQLVERGAEALMVVGRIEDKQLLELIKDKALPAVCTYSIASPSFLPSVGFDNYQTMRQVLRYVLRLGHRRLAMIAGPTKGNDRQQARIKAFEDTRVEHGIQDPWPVLENRYDNALAEGTSAMRLIHAQYPDVTAIVCNSDSFAFGALTECHRLALRVPEDISIVGHDDQDFAELLDPPLTTVAVPARQMGQLSAQELLQALENGRPPQTVRLDAELLIRGTVSRPAANNATVADAAFESQQAKIASR